jgi:hypothetical protein
MKRRWFAVLGAFLLLTWGAFSLAVGPSVDASFLLDDLPYVLAGVLLVAAGTTDGVAGIEWYQFAGLGFVCLGLSMTSELLLTLTRAGSVTSGAFASAAVSALLGLVLAVMGFDWIRGGNHFDLSTFDPGPIYGG